MLLLIFGAGASYDAVSPAVILPDSQVHKNWRPPLATELFQNRDGFRDALTRFPRILPIAARLAHASQSLPVEQELARFASEVEAYPERAADLASVRYYLQFILWACEHQWITASSAITNYLALLDHVESTRRSTNDVAVVTFNYDRLFEYAATFYLTKRAKILESDYTSMTSYLTHTSYPLFKLHGSINWGHRVLTDVGVKDGENVYSVAAKVIDHASSLRLAPEVEMVHDRPPRLVDGNVYTPALAIPVDAKADFVCPSDHVEALTKLLPRTTGVVIVGWRATEAAFLSLLAKELTPNVRIMVANGCLEESKSSLARLSDAGVLGDQIPLKYGFSDLIGSPELVQHLRHSFGG